MARNRRGVNQRKRKNNQREDGRATRSRTGEAGAAKEKTAEQHTRELFSWFADDHSIWSKEDCAALAKAALSIRQLTEAESITYYKAIRDGK